jgi:hypothetical protein
MQAQPLMLPEGDFALGIRAIADDVDASFTRGDFATGMRTKSQSLIVGMFATGQTTTRNPVVRGSFATGQGSDTHHARVPRLRPHGHEHGQSAVGAPAMEAGLS